MQQIVLLDTTLRDGEQSPGATMNLQEKLRLARQLESLGVDVIEAGFPAASQGDFDAVRRIADAVRSTQIAALCRATPDDIDRSWEALCKAEAPRLHLFLAGSPLHLRYKLRKSPDEVLEMTEAMVRRAVGYTANVQFSVEDASRAEPEFLARMLATAVRAGAAVVNIADTVGYAQPAEFAALIRFLLEQVPGIEKSVLGVHCHNDLGLAVANTLAALDAGARQAEVTLCGLGERAGNAALEEVVMALQVRQDTYKLCCNVHPDQIFPSCRLLSMILGRPIPPTKAIVGENAFSHESGIHQDGVLKHRATYEIMTPASIGRTASELVIGKHSGRAAVRSRLLTLGYSLSELELECVIDAVKELADKKAVIHDEDLEAMVFSSVYRLPDMYRLANVHVHSTMGSMPATAAVVMDILDGDNRHTVRAAGFGVGPIDAAFNVVCQLVGRAPTLEHFAINAITGGMDALGEVTVRLAEHGSVSVGRAADPDVIVASVRAYIDALNRFAQKEKERGECRREG